MHGPPPTTHTVITSVRRNKLRWCFWLDPTPSRNATAATSARPYDRVSSYTPCPTPPTPPTPVLRATQFSRASSSTPDRAHRKFIPVCRVRVRAEMSRGKERRRTSRPLNLHIWLRVAAAPIGIAKSQIGLVRGPTLSPPFPP